MSIEFKTPGSESGLRRGGCGEETDRSGRYLRLRVPRFSLLIVGCLALSVAVSTVCAFCSCYQLTRQQGIADAVVRERGGRGQIATRLLSDVGLHEE